MAAGSTYTPIATSTLGSAAATISFSSIPSTYTDIVLVFNGGTTAGPAGITANFNGDSGTNYSDTLLRGDGASVISARDTNGTYMSAMGYAGTPLGSTVITFHVMNYSNTTTYKTVLNRGNLASNFVNASVGLWRSTAAINSILLTSFGTTFLSGSTFTLYGIAAA